MKAEGKYIQMGEKAWLPLLTVRKISCCDCGLVHLWEFTRKKVDGRWQYGFVVTRDNRATAQLRRPSKIPKKKSGRVAKKKR